MPNEVVGFKINGSTYEYDHEHLANLPTIDTEPTANSTNAVQSGGVKSALDGLQAEIPIVDSTPTQGSNNAVSSGGMWSALQNVPQIDNTLTRSGQGADSAITGKRFDFLDSIVSLEEMVEIPFIIAGSGYISSTGGVGSPSSVVYKYTDYIPFGEFSTLLYKRGGITSSASQYVAVYDENKNFLRSARWASNQESAGYLENLSKITKQNDGAYYVRFTVFADTDTYGDFAVYGSGYPLEEKLNGVANKVDSIPLLDLIAGEPLSYSVENKKYVRADTGSVQNATNYEATGFVDIDGCDYLVYSQLMLTNSTTNGGLAFYTENNADAFIADSSDYCGVNAEEIHYEPKALKVPETAKYARFTVSKLVSGFFIKGIKSNPLKGLKISLLSDSISTFAGYIPEGNQAYYTGSNAGIKSVNEIWWKVLCNNTGMIPLVMDAWSGSSVCYNYATDSTHSDTNKIPMCSDLRTGRLGTETDDPDIIIVAGGTNDWTYSAQTTTPLGDWNGRTAISREDVVSGESTFAESYASMLTKLRENYPDAIIVCASMFFTCRGTSLSATRVNDMGYTEYDYSAVVEKICKIMGVPFIDIYNVGFNFENYYPTYAEDSATLATHPNAKGHAVIAKRFIDTLPNLVKQFK